jgi:hypothetical protein
MEKTYLVKVISHDNGPECVGCGRPMSAIELIDKVPLALANVAYTCFRCVTNEQERGE